MHDGYEAEFRHSPHVTQNSTAIERHHSQARFEADPHHLEFRASASEFAEVGLYIPRLHDADRGRKTIRMRIALGSDGVGLGSGAGDAIRAFMAVPRNHDRAPPPSSMIASLAATSACRASSRAPPGALESFRRARENHSRRGHGAPVPRTQERARWRLRLPPAQTLRKQDRPSAYR